MSWPVARRGVLVKLQFPSVSLACCGVYVLLTGEKETRFLYCEGAKSAWEFRCMSGTLCTLSSFCAKLSTSLTDGGQAPNTTCKVCGIHAQGCCHDAGLFGFPAPSGDMLASRRKRWRAERDAALGLPTALDGSHWRVLEPPLCDRSNAAARQSAHAKPTHFRETQGEGPAAPRRTWTKPELPVHARAPARCALLLSGRQACGLRSLRPPHSIPVTVRLRQGGVHGQHQPEAAGLGRAALARRQRRRRLHRGAGLWRTGAPPLRVFSGERQSYWGQYGPLTVLSLTQRANAPSRLLGTYLCF